MIPSKARMLGRQTIKDVRAVIAFFNKGHSIKEISTETELCFRGVQRLTQQYRDTEHQSLPAVKPSRRKMINPKTVNVERQVDTHPSIKARAVKETNSNLPEYCSAASKMTLCHRFRARRKPGFAK